MAGENGGKTPSYLHDELDAAYTPPVSNDVGAELYLARLAVDGCGCGVSLGPEEAAPVGAKQSVPETLRTTVDCLDFDAVSETIRCAVQVQQSGSTANTNARRKGLLTELQMNIVSTAATLGREMQLAPEGPCPCCSATAPVPCWSHECGCKICYVCYRVVSMSKQALCEPLRCPACEAVITGVDLERDGGQGGGGKRMFEKTPMPSSVKSGELAADADADAEAENVHPNTASQEPPKKKPRRAAECSVCRQAGLTTPTTTKIGTTSHNRP
ncbi:hypothetical protein M885DRAFT_570092 [Pelagophyceae sp. CCMP2097]|nr:hypothetical protein M885DRAFT_570092 [Pelagophyceae sp. CCMP2097]